MDAYSKWPEVFNMKSTTSTSCIRVLRSLFSRFGIPLKLVSDNGPQFVSEEFGNFLSDYQISHSKSAPYHPATNGEAERFVQTWKQYLKISNPSVSELETALHSFLLTYRTSRHATTNATPSELMFKRQIRNVISLVQPSLSAVSDYRASHKKDSSAVRAFGENDAVMVRNYRSSNKWIPGVIKQVIGNLHYLVTTSEGVVKRHIDQLRRNSACNRDNRYDLCDLVDVGRGGDDPGGAERVPAPGSLPRRSTRGIPPNRLNL